MNCFRELQKIRDDYNTSLNNKMNEISIDALSKIDIKIGDIFIPFDYDKGNASFVVTEDHKDNAIINFTIGKDVLEIRFIGNTVCSNGKIFENEEKYCGFTLNENGNWIISDWRYEFIRPL